MGDQRGFIFSQPLFNVSESVEESETSTKRCVVDDNCSSKSSGRGGVIVYVVNAN